MWVIAYVFHSGEQNDDFRFTVLVYVSELDFRISLIGWIASC